MSLGTFRRGSASIALGFLGGRCGEKILWKPLFEGSEYSRTTAPICISMTEYHISDCYTLRLSLKPYIL
jgi:hypothetical protein